MFMIQLEWKEHSINLAMLDQKLRADHPQYVGNQAHRHLELWFSEEPAQEAIDAIHAYWESLDEESEEALAYKPASQLAQEESERKAAIQAVKLGMLEKTWANMNAIERKLYLGLDSEVSHADLVAAQLI